jgi:hypothetical protein
LIWWERVAKPQISEIFISEGTERRRDDNTLENVHHACLYEVIQYPHQVEGMAAVNRIKAKS